MYQQQQYSDGSQYNNASYPQNNWVDSGPQQQQPAYAPGYPPAPGVMIQQPVGYGYGQARYGNSTCCQGTNAAIIWGIVGFIFCYYVLPLIIFFAFFYTAKSEVDNIAEKHSFNRPPPVHQDRELEEWEKYLQQHNHGK